MQCTFEADPTSRCIGHPGIGSCYLWLRLFLPNLLSALFSPTLDLSFPSCFPPDSFLNQNAFDLPGFLFCPQSEEMFLTPVHSSPSRWGGQTQEALPLPFPNGNLEKQSILTFAKHSSAFFFFFASKVSSATQIQLKSFKSS